MIYVYRVIHFYYQMCFKASENRCIGIHELYPAYFSSAPRLPWKDCFKKTKLGLETLMDVDVILMAEKGTRGVMYHGVYCYSK